MKRLRLLAVLGWVAVSAAAVALLWLRWPQAQHPMLWRQVAAWTGIAGAGVCAMWGVVAFRAMLVRRDPVALLAFCGLLVVAVSFLASPAVVWLRLAEGVQAQYVAWAIRLAGLLMLLPHAAAHLWRVRPQ